MANLASILKDEIARISRREVKKATDPLRKASAAQRKDIASLKRDLAESSRELKVLSKQLAKTQSSPASAGPAAPAGRISANGIKSLRKKLGLSAEQFGSLVGITGQTVYLWERAKTSPRGPQLAKLLSLRSARKKDVVALVHQSQASAKKANHSTKNSKRKPSRKPAGKKSASRKTVKRSKTS